MHKAGGKSASVLAMAIFILAISVWTSSALAVTPTVKTVPWVASNPLIPHDTWSGKQITLKGTTDVTGSNFEYWWDFGDASATAPANVNTGNYALQAFHTYTGPTGTIITATLNVRDKTTNETGSKPYLIEIRAQALSIEVNVAIDEGLWYLHKTQVRSSAGGIDYGTWNSYWGRDGAAINAFEVNGHTQSLVGDDNPYKETVARGLNRLFASYLTVYNISNPNSYGRLVEDYNNNGVMDAGEGNGKAIRIGSSNYYYEDGMIVDAIIASGTPNAIAQTGPVGVIGRTYKDIVQDMVDALVNGQYGHQTAVNRGGWYYSWGGAGDNSISQWSAIGLIPAIRNGWALMPNYVTQINPTWLFYSQAAAGNFGYQDQNTIWGPYAVTPSGMVQMVMDGIGRGDNGSPAAGMPSWDKAEKYIHGNFGTVGNYSNAVKSYYYGLFSFVKSMRLHQPPIVILRDYTKTPIQDIDWYSAEISKGDWTNGIARTLVNDQYKSSDANNGNWTGHYATGEQNVFETPWAIMMLSSTLFEAGSPVAIAKAIPNPGIAFQTINFDGSQSFQQDATKTIVSWQWDFNNDGTPDATGPFATYSWPAVGNYPVTLIVTDNNNPAKTASTTITVMITTPPIAPTANAGGPYNFCSNRQPWYLDGTKSKNPDDGQHEPGPYPGDFIKSYGWDLNGDNAFADATGSQPNVTAFFTAAGEGSYLIQLKVTDNTAASFPSAGLGDLFNTSSAQVYVLPGTDPKCAGCISDLKSLAKNKQVQLTWTAAAGAHHYNVYRSTVNGGPYLFVGTAPSNIYFDYTVANGTTYYYVVRPAALNNNEACQSNQVSAIPILRR